MRQLETEGGREDIRIAIGNLAKSKLGVVQGEDGHYEWGDPRCGGTYGILVLS